MRLVETKGANVPVSNHHVEMHTGISAGPIESIFIAAKLE